MADRIIGEHYQLQKELGTGGMGIVYRGLDKRTGQAVAIKQLKSELVQSDMIERFNREGEALRELNHPNIVKMLDTVEQDGQHYLVMEYLPSGDLNQLLKDGKLPIKQTLEITLDLADALTRAHRLNIIHRDLKPANILIAEDGTPRLSDFGVAHFSERDPVTQSGVAVGTLDYLSPEALNGEDPDVRADIWAFGVILFEMLAGQRPFQGEGVAQIVTRIVTAGVPDLEDLRPDAPVPLIDLIYRMLAKNPADRIPSVRLIGAELEALLHNNPLPSRSQMRLGVATQANTSASIPVPARTVRYNLPNQTTAFVGREAEMEVLRQLLLNPNNQLVTIFAPGGMGKTRLSIAVAQSLFDHFPQGVFFVELAPIQSSDAIPAAVGKALGYPFQEDDRSPQQQLVDYFRDKAQLLILDNFEHVIAGREFVQAVLQAAPQLNILVTSRMRLNLSGETVFQLEGMESPNWETPADVNRHPSVRLFLESARRVRPDFTLNADNLPAVARICRFVQGLPLAIVLAGTWLELLSPREIADEIEQSADFLETTLHDIPERQRTMRAVFEYTWRLLTEDERTVFARLSVFRAGMTREAAQAVTHANLRALQSLVNKSILRRDNTTGRYEIHELLRQYAHEYLTQTGLLPDTLRNHTNYFVAFLTARATEIKGGRQLESLREIEADFENVKIAWHDACEHHDEQAVDSMLEPLYWFCIFRSRNMEGMALFQFARRQWPIHQSARLAARLLVRYPDPQPDLTATYETGLKVARQYADQQEIAFCLRRLGHWLSHSQLQHATGIPYLLDSLAQYRALNDRFYEALVLDDLGWSYSLTDEVARQIAHVQQCLDIRRQLGDKVGVVNALRNMGGATGGFSTTSPEPQRYLKEALQLAFEINDRTNIAWNCFLISLYNQYLGKFTDAQGQRELAREVAEQINDRVILGLCDLCDALDRALIHEDYQQAKQMTITTYSPDSPVDSRFLIYQLNCIFLASAQDDYNLLRTSLNNLIRFGFPKELVAFIVFSSMVLAASEARYEQATELLGTFVGEPHNALNLMISEWGWFQRFQARLEQEMGAEPFQVVLQRGQTQDFFELAQRLHDEIVP